MDIGTALGISWIAFCAAVGLAVGWRSISAKRRAERNLRLLLDGIPERENLAELILRNPNTENIQKGRTLVISVVDSLSPRDRREISSGLYQDSVEGRAWYVAKLVTDGRSSNIRRIPSDERVTG